MQPRPTYAGNRLSRTAPFLCFVYVRLADIGVFSPSSFIVTGESRHPNLWFLYRRPTVSRILPLSLRDGFWCIFCVWRVYAAHPGPRRGRTHVRLPFLIEHMFDVWRIYYTTRRLVIYLCNTYT